MRVNAEVHSDDHVYEVEFDAAPWFCQAAEEEILRLASCEWGGDYPSDQVAIDSAEWNPEVAAMFGYLEKISDLRSHKDMRGFECNVDEEDALRWLESNRPHLFQQLPKEEDL